MPSVTDIITVPWNNAVSVWTSLLFSGCYGYRSYALYNFFSHLQHNVNFITVAVFEFTLPLSQLHKSESNQGKLIQFSDLFHFAVRHSTRVGTLTLNVPTTTIVAQPFSVNGNLNLIR